MPYCMVVVTIRETHYKYTLRWCIASQYGLAPLHPLLFSVLLVVPGLALASVSPDGERSVNFVLQWSYFLYKFCNESEGSCDPSG